MPKVALLRILVQETTKINAEQENICGVAKCLPKRTHNDNALLQIWSF